MPIATSRFWSETSRRAASSIAYVFPTPGAAPKNIVSFPRVVFDSFRLARTKGSSLGRQEHHVGQHLAERRRVRQLTRLREVRLPEQELGVELDPRIVLVLLEYRRQLRNERMAGIDLQHRASLLRLLPELLEHFLHPRAHVVVVRDEAYGRRRQPTRKTNLLYVVLQGNSQAREQIAVFAALVLERLGFLLTLLVGPELDLPAPYRRERLVLELGALGQPYLVDGIREKENLVSLLNE